MDDIEIQFPDGNNKKLPDISCKLFSESPMFKQGSSDVEYRKYMHKNDMQDITDYNSQTTPDIILVVKDPHTERVIKFACIYDSDNDENFNSSDHF